MGWNVYVADEVCYVVRCTEDNWSVDPSRPYDEPCGWSFGPSFDRAEAECQRDAHWKAHEDAYHEYCIAVDRADMAESGPPARYQGEGDWSDGS